MGRPDAVSVRERRVVVAGAAVVGIALLVTYGLLPFAQHWQTRERALDAARARVAYLQELITRTSSLESAAADAERVLSMQSRRVLHARSSTLAASALQTFLQDAADASHLAVTRLEVSPDDSVRADGVNAEVSQQSVGTATVGTATVGTATVGTVTVGTVTGVTRLPAALSAYGDVGGVAALLDFLATGPRVLSIERVSLLRNAALLGAPDVVQITLSLRAPVLPE